MARQIRVKDGDLLWRAVTVFKHPETGETFTHYEGPYPNEGTAKARITFWKSHGYKMVKFDYNNNDRTKWEYVSGTWEPGVTTWASTKEN